MKCPVCNETDHASNAFFCHMCGSRLVKRKPKWLWLVGIMVLLLVGLYRLLFYASYLNISGVQLSDKGGTTSLYVGTDAVFVSLKTKTCNWVRVTQFGKNIHLEYDENRGAKDRHDSFTIKTGVIDNWCKLRKEVTITQAGKGATYCKVNPSSVELKGEGARSRVVSVDTDGDRWEVMSHPEWVLCKIDGNKLELSAKNNTKQDRESVLLVKSYNEYAEIHVSQKMETQPVAKPTPKPMSSQVRPVSPEPITEPLYIQFQHEISDAPSFSRIMISNREVDGKDACKLLKQYENIGYRLPNRIELIFLFEHHIETLPNPEHGYWIKYNEKGDIQSLSYGFQGEIDPTPNENRVVLIK